MYHPIVKSVVFVALIYLVLGGVMNYTPVGPWFEREIPWLGFDLVFTLPAFVWAAYLGWSYRNHPSDWEAK